MPAVVAIYPDEVDGWHPGAARSPRLRILSSQVHTLEEKIWQNALKLWKKPC